MVESPRFHSDETQEHDSSLHRLANYSDDACFRRS
jgi:hypothetical protein